jgi:hypothetical protein
MNWRYLIALLFAAGTASAQQTWKVNCSGAHGAHFTDLPPAVAAASPGDTILVYGVAGGPCGAYYTAPTINKPLHIVGFAVGQPSGNNNPSQIRLRGTLQVVGLASGEQATLSNIFITHEVFPAPWISSDCPVTLTDCAGSVLFEDVFYRNSGTPGQVVRIERCDDVVLRGSAFYVGGDSIRVIDSNVLMTNTLVQYALPDSLNPYTAVTESVFLQRSTLTLVASFVLTMGGLPPNPAVRMDTSTLRLGATGFVRGGLLPQPSSPPLPWDYAPAYVFVGTGPSAVYKDPRAPALWGFPATPPIPTTIDETYHDWLVADEAFEVRVMGPAGGFAALMLGNWAPPVATPFGTLGMDPSTAWFVTIAALPQPDGFRAFPFASCPASAPVGYGFCFQALTLSPTGVFGLTEPSPLTVAWDKSAIP